MRYTEARLTPISIELLKDIEKDVVNMVDNYSGSEKEPEVLPARYPNLLVNGAFGIAVGLATNIPPHNLSEVIDASVAYIENPEIDTVELMEHVKGPDLPTGGILIGKNSMRSAYETGEGKVTLRAKTSIETLENGRLGIVITEFPYRKNKAKLLQTISEMTADKRHAKVLDSISDIRDESDRTGIRAVIEFKKSADKDSVEKILKYLFKRTDLQCNVSFNMVALAQGKPQTMGLKTILVHYVNHRKEVVTRRTEKELEVAEKRFHIVEGFIKAIGIMDEIIKTIRSSKSKKDAGENLINKFGFTQIQAEAILELMLYRLTGLEVVAFEKEHKELEKIINKLKKILSSEKELLKVIKKELTDIKEQYGNVRRTAIVENDEEAKIDVEDLIVEEDIVVTMSNEGFVKRVPLRTYNRLNADVQDIEYREGDFHRLLINLNTKDTLMFFTDKGNMYQTKGINIPEFKWKDKGERIENIIKALDLSEENIVSVHSINNFSEEKDFMLFTDKGNIKKTGIDKFNSTYTKLVALKLKGEEHVLQVQLVSKNREEKFINVVTEKGLEFVLKEPKIEEADRNILSTELFNLCSSDKVEKMEFTDKFLSKNFTVNINKSGILKIHDGKTKGVYTNTNSKLLVFCNDGMVFSLSALLIQNIDKNGINISDLWDGINKDSILKIVSIEDFKEEGCIYFFTKNGMIKKTAISEFEGNFNSTLAYKLRNETDILVNVECSKEKEEQVLMITKKAMAIMFDANSVNFMGKIASGVTGISLKDDDEVIYAVLINNSKDFNSVEIKSANGIMQNIKAESIKLQNRAGRGKCLTVVVMDDYIIEAQVKY